MSKLFSATPSMVTTKAQRDQSKARAMEAARIIDEANLDESTANNLQGKIDLLKQVVEVQGIHYTSYRKPGKRWLIEHARAGADYMFQLIPIKPTQVSEQQILYLLIQAMDVIYPKSVQIYYNKPNMSMKINYWTIKVANVAEMPGFERARDRTLVGLCDVDAWQ